MRNKTRLLSSLMDLKLAATSQKTLAIEEEVKNIFIPGSQEELEILSNQGLSQLQLDLREFYSRRKKEKFSR